MRALMGLHKNEHGIWHVRRKVPKRLETAVAQVLNNGKQRQSWLSRSLRTGDLQKANILAKPVMIEFDRVLAEAEALLSPPKSGPLRASLSNAEIEQIADYHYATLLSDDSAARREGWRYRSGGNAGSGLSDEQFDRIGRSNEEALAESKAALARGNISLIEPEVDELLSLVFRINLDRQGSSYRRLAHAVLSADVRAREARRLRHAGEPLGSPKQPEPNPTATEGETLSAALAGWKKERQRSPGTLTEYERAITLFIELHGNMPVVAIKKSHARQFREALQDMPRHRAGKLASARLPELAAWGREHSTAPKLTPPTVNKLLGGVQAIVVWGHDKGGMVPDDIPWADPFSKMRLQEDESEREPFEIAELNKLFASPVFTKGNRPGGGKGDAAFWLPLLGLFTGARRGELAALTPADVKDGVTPTMEFSEDRERDKRLKTRTSRRTVPIHPRLVELGFLSFVARERKARGANAWLFPEIAPDASGGVKAWTKWFSRYIRGDEVGITDSTKVFHSFRHNFKDALRQASIGEDVIDALAGHGTRGTVARGYGAKDMLRRFTLPVLSAAIEKAEYPGLDLSRVTSTGREPPSKRKAHTRR